MLVIGGVDRMIHVYSKNLEEEKCELEY